MTEFLQVLGSIASIGAIPLAIYLYLRSREARNTKLRRDIVKTLSYQIGEGRNLSVFEIQAVIDSHARAADGRALPVEVADVVEDLVTETIASPLLDSTRKSDILRNLQELHQRAGIASALERYSLSYLQFLSAIKGLCRLTPEDQSIIEAGARVPEHEPRKKAPSPLIDPELFAWVGAVFTTLSFLFVFFGRNIALGSGLKRFLADNEFLLSLLLGMAASALAIGFSFVYARVNAKIGRRDNSATTAKN